MWPGALENRSRDDILAADWLPRAERLFWCGKSSFGPMAYPADVTRLACCYDTVVVALGVFRGPTPVLAHFRIHDLAEQT